jgi:hypothetical protein
VTKAAQANEKLVKVVSTALSADAAGGQPIDETVIIETVLQYAPIAGKGLTDEEIKNVVAELTRRFNVWTGRAGTLVGSDPGHQVWLPAKRAEIQWRFWERYQEFIQESLPPRVVSELDEMTSHVLGLLEDPCRPGAWRRQGLVVGHVQSGKTGNYTGLLCKAADAGYKVVVVLSGIHNSLRAQTQIRLDEGFLGYARPFGASNPARSPIGVGSIDPRPIADSVTTRDERGDFSKTKAQGFQIHAGGNVLLFVVKKNVRVLSNLIDWARLSAKKAISDGKSVVGDVPLLVIDDEADQASIDTKVQAFDESTNLPDTDHDPSAINHLIRQLLDTFERRAYVGYTATPFANVFIHPEGKTTDAGEDLFPKHFIVNLSAPSNYFGPARVFGRNEVDAPDQGAIPSRIRFVTDADEWVPPSHKSSLVPRFGGQNRVPPSLAAAVRSFLLASAARRARGQLNGHNTMLVHVTRFTDVQKLVHAQLRRLVDDLRVRWRARITTANDTLLSEMRELWDADFVRTSATSIPWALVEPHIWPILELLQVNLINAKASDALVYEEHREHGLNVIAVGGDKLSRGLTLEGLSVSYFLRAARMYDTLMQMGRWFGYRPDYEDLCRLFLSEELADWYGHITEAAEELRQEFDHMVLLGGTPDDYGLRVRTHPVLAITGKLRPGTPEISMSLSATAFEPTLLAATPAALVKNWASTQALIVAMGSPAQVGIVSGDCGTGLNRGSWEGGTLWRDVAGGRIVELLDKFEFADKQLTKTPPIAVRRYVKDRIAHAELTSWTVVVLGKGEHDADADEPSDEVLPTRVRVCDRLVWTLTRSPVKRSSTPPGVFVTKRLGSPRDESIDLSPEQSRAISEQLSAAKRDPQRDDQVTRGMRIRQIRSREHGLLILYLLAPPKSVERDGYPAVPMVAPYISFPHSPNATAISYKVSHRYWEDELRGVE